MEKQRGHNLLALLTIGLLGFLVMAEQLVLTDNNRAYADGSGSPSACKEQTNPTGIDGSVGNNANFVSKTAPTGKIITGVCIKSGNNMFIPNKHSGVLGNNTYENGCYTVAGVGTSTASVTRNFDTNLCQGISHIDFIYGTATLSTPTPTPTNIPTVTPTNSPTVTPTPTVLNTPTPTPTISQNCTCEENYEDPTPTIMVNPTTTVTLNDTPTPTPTQNSNNGSNSTSSTTNDNTPHDSVQGIQATLGKSTMAATGTFTNTVMNLFFAAGMMVIALATLYYVKEKKA
jgi:hypothetical protein